MTQNYQTVVNVHEAPAPRAEERVTVPRRIEIVPRRPVDPQSLEITKRINLLHPAWVPMHLSTHPSLSVAEHACNVILRFATVTNGELAYRCYRNMERKVGLPLAQRLSLGLKESIAYGYAHQDESIPYALQWGRGIDRALGERFVKMYVSQLTIDMGRQGEDALRELFRLGAQKRVIPPVSLEELV